VTPAPSGRTQAQRSAATRDAIIAAATTLIAERGFESTGIDEIARAAGVSKGAVYHQFADKVEVLAAVYERVEQRLTERLLEVAAAAGDPLQALRNGAQAFLDACLDPLVHRIALIEAPAGLGWERWRAIDARYGFGLLQAGLEAAANEGLIAGDNLAERAHLLLAALIEASLLLRRTTDPAGTRAVVGDVIDGLITAIAKPTTRRPTRRS
jgi:AcrR family transcriptional regulator